MFPRLLAVAGSQRRVALNFRVTALSQEDENAIWSLQKNDLAAFLGSDGDRLRARNIVNASGEG
jgi:hypothetical protein